MPTRRPRGIARRTGRRSRSAWSTRPRSLKTSISRRPRFAPSSRTSSSGRTSRHGRGFRRPSGATCCATRSRVPGSFAGSCRGASDSSARSPTSASPRCVPPRGSWSARREASFHERSEPEPPRDPRSGDLRADDAQGGRGALPRDRARSRVRPRGVPVEPRGRADRLPAAAPRRARCDHQSWRARAHLDRAARCRGGLAVSGRGGSHQRDRRARGVPEEELSHRGDRVAVHRQRRGGIRAGPTLAHRGDEENVISAGEIKRGMTIELDGVLYQIVEFQHIKLGRGSAQMRMKLRNVRKGDLVEKTFQANDRYQRARLDHRNVQVMYKDGTHYHFMVTATYVRIALDDDQLGDATNYLTDGMTVILSEYEGSPIGVEMPASVVLTVTDTDLGLKGDTATGATKPATLETGIRVNVPLFVERGDKIKVDTRTGEYLERA